jgi:DNA polymerase III subunit beta
VVDLVVGALLGNSQLSPTEFAHTATVEIAPLKEAVQRGALVATRNTPVRLTFTTDGTLVLEAGTSDEVQAVDNVTTALEGGDLNIAFNPGFLIDGLDALTTEAAEAVDFHFTSSTKPAILRGHASDNQGLRYALMPVLSSADRPAPDVCGAAVDTGSAAPQRHPARTLRDRQGASSP